MALAELLASIEAEADAQIRALRAAGAADASAIEAAAERARGDQRERDRSASRTALQLAADGEVAEAARRYRAAVLATRAAMLDRVRASARTQLASLLDEVSARALIDAALACAHGPGIIRCAPQFADQVRPPGELRVEHDPTVTGVEIELANGTRIVATLDALFDREWPRLAATALDLIDAKEAA